MKLKFGTSVNINYLMPLSAALAVTSFVLPNPAAAQFQDDSYSNCMNSLMYKTDAYGNRFPTGMSGERAARTCRRPRTPEGRDAFTSCVNSLMWTQPDAYGNVFSTGRSQEDAARACGRSRRQRVQEAFTNCVNSMMYAQDTFGNRVPTGVSGEDAAIACRNRQSY